MVDRALTVYVGEAQTPSYDLTPYVKWEDCSFSTQASMGESTVSNIVVRDEDGVMGPWIDGGITLATRNVVKLTLGSNVLWRGRIIPRVWDRGEQIADKAREVTIEAEDSNSDLRMIIVDSDRPAETDVARVQGIMASYLSGSPRQTTNLNGSNYVSGSNLISLAAKHYTQTDPQGVLTDIATQTHKEFYVVDSGTSLFYDAWDSLAYACSYYITDNIGALRTDPGNALTILPNGPRFRINGQRFLSGVRVYYGAGENDYVYRSNPVLASIKGWWEESVYASDATTATEAARYAETLLAERSQDGRTLQCRVGSANEGPLTDAQVGSIKAGMRIRIHNKVIPTFPVGEQLVRIVHLTLIPTEVPGQWWADLQLEKPERAFGIGDRAQTTKPDLCRDEDEASVNILLNFDWQTAPAHTETIPAYGGVSQPAIVLVGGENPLIIPGDYYIGLENESAGTGYVYIPVTPGSSYTVDLTYSTAQHHSLRDIEPVVLDWVSGAYSGNNPASWTTISQDSLALEYSPNALRSAAIAGVAPGGATGLRILKDDAGTTLTFYVHSIIVAAGSSPGGICPPPSATVAEGEESHGTSNNASPADHTHAHGDLSGSSSPYHLADSVEVTPFSTIAATNVQDALEEIVSETTGGAPTTADYLVGTAQGGLSAEIVVGTTPGGELGNTWASPTVDATHSGSNHNQPVRKNSTGTVFERRRLNLIEGTNVTLTVADDAGNDEVDITIASSGGGSGIAVEEDGVEEGTGIDRLDFTGDITVSVSGSQATINATTGGGSDWDGTVEQAADQSVTDSATPVDSDMVVAMDASSVYEFDFSMIVSSSNTTGDLRWRFVYPTITRVQQSHGNWETLSGTGANSTRSALGAVDQFPATDDQIDTGGTIDVKHAFYGRFVVTSDGAGDLKFQFANFSAAAGRISRLHAGSRLRYRKLG